MRLMEGTGPPIRGCCPPPSAPADARLVALGCLEEPKEVPTYTPTQMQKTSGWWAAWITMDIKGATLHGRACRGEVHGRVQGE